MLTKEQYLADPCAAASVPYWKARTVSVPDGMKILREDEYDPAAFPQYRDEPYFRLIHDLKKLTQPTLPQGYSLCKPDFFGYAAHINSCYDRIGTTGEQLHVYTFRPVYDGSLWIALKENATGVIAATGIAELDRDIREGALEWIQVSPSHRRKGLGAYVVRELLWRMARKADFATVSGQCGSLTNPEGLYRRCGFTGDHVWHILRKLPG